MAATTIDLSLSVFPWAKFRKTKGVIKLNVGLDADGYLLSFISLTDGKGHEGQWAKALNLPRGAIALFDRGFNDYQWYQALTKAGVFFVTRLKSNAVIESVPRRPGSNATGINEDRTVFLGSIPEPFRLVYLPNPETGKEFRFFTNAHHLDAKTIAELYESAGRLTCRCSRC